MAVERERRLYFPPLHDREGGGIHGGKLVKISPLEVAPASPQVVQIALEDLKIPNDCDRFLPGNGHIAVSVSIQEGEGLQHNGNRCEESDAVPQKPFPELSRLVVERIPGEHEGDPDAAVDEDRLPLTDHG